MKKYSQEQAFSRGLRQCFLTIEIIMEKIFKSQSSCHSKINLNTSEVRRLNKTKFSSS